MQATRPKVMLMIALAAVSTTAQVKADPTKVAPPLTMEEKARVAVTRQDEMDARLLARARHANDIMCVGCTTPNLPQPGKNQQRERMSR